jgi:hypothetical protein
MHQRPDRLSGAEAISQEMLAVAEPKLNPIEPPAQGEAGRICEEPGTIDCVAAVS